MIMKVYIKSSLETSLLDRDSLINMELYEFDEYFEDYLVQYLAQSLSRYNLWSEPSVRGGIGSDFWLDEDTDEVVVEIDFEEEMYEIQHLTIRSDGNLQKFKKLLDEYVDSMIDENK